MSTKSVELSPLLYAFIVVMGHYFIFYISYLHFLYGLTLCLYGGCWSLVYVSRHIVDLCSLINSAINKQSKQKWEVKCWVFFSSSYRLHISAFYALTLYTCIEENSEEEKQLAITFLEQKCGRAQKLSHCPMGGCDTL